MPRYLRYFLGGLAVLIICMPIAFIGTILLIPLWSWIEATYAIESIGHSGPSDWCFELVYGLMAATGLAVYAMVQRSRQASHR